MIDIQSPCGACMHAAVCVYRKSVDAAVAAVLKIKEELDYSPIVSVKLECEHFRGYPYTETYPMMTFENSSSACAAGTAIK